MIDLKIHKVQKSNFNNLYSMNHISLRPQFVMKNNDQEVFEKNTYYLLYDTKRKLRYTYRARQKGMKQECN